VARGHWVQHNRLFQVDPASRQVREVTDGGRSLAIDHLAYAGGWVWGLPIAGAVEDRRGRGCGLARWLLSP
jgi:hypothetical protein